MHLLEKAWLGLGMGLYKRNVVAGAALLGVCLLLASLNWLQLLLVVLVACLACSSWSWINALEMRRKQKHLQKRWQISHKLKVVRNGNVYQFPTKINASANKFSK